MEDPETDPQTLNLRWQVMEAFARFVVGPHIRICNFAFN